MTTARCDLCNAIRPENEQPGDWCDDCGTCAVHCAGHGPNPDDKRDELRERAYERAHGDGPDGDGSQAMWDAR